MELSKTVACTALLLVVLLGAGHAFGQVGRTLGTAAQPGCVIKPVMTDAEIERCRVEYRRSR